MVYLDTSFVVPWLLPEPASAKVEEVLTALAPGSSAISLWTKLEFASVVARRVRTGEATAPNARAAIDLLDELLKMSLESIEPVSADFTLASQLVVDSGWTLRGPDALHLAIARNHRAEVFLTLDEPLLKSAVRLGIPASKGIA